MNQARSGSRSKLLVAVVGLGGTLGGTGCTPSNSVKSGAPVMLSFGPADSNGNAVSLTSDAGPVSAPPLVHFVAIFDRVLDGDSLDDADGGAPKAGLAASEYGAPAAPLPVITTYNPSGDSVFYGYSPPGPSLTVSAVCGLPTSSPVQIALDLTKFRSHDLSTVATVGPGVTSTLSFTTDALTATIDVPAPAEDPGAGLLEDHDPQTVVTVTFNDLTPSDAPLPGCPAPPSTANHIHVGATLAGVPVLPFEAVVAPAANDPTKWNVSPPGTTADAKGSWPAGALVTVTIDADASDIFQKTLGSPTTATFMVKS